MILYIFQSFLWYYKYRYCTFYSQNYRVIPSVSIRYIDVIHLHQSWQKKKIKLWEFATLQSHEFILKWRIRVTPPGQMFKAPTPWHSMTTYRSAFSFLTADCARAGSALGLTCSCNTATRYHTRPPRAALALNPRANSDTTRSPTDPSPRKRWPRGQGTPFNTEGVLTQRM